MATELPSPVRIIMPATAGDPVRLQDPNIETAQIGQVIVSPDQWREFVRRAKAGDLDLED
jgi:hypothetical protein